MPILSYAYLTFFNSLHITEAALILISKKKILHKNTGVEKWLNIMIIMKENLKAHAFVSTFTGTAAPSNLQCKKI